MRYWQHGETGRLLKIDVQMAPSHWGEITKEQYEEALEWSEKGVDKTPTNNVERIKENVEQDS